MTLVNDIKPTGMDSAYVGGRPFDQAKKTLEGAGYNIITLEQNAGLRVSQGRAAIVSREGNYVAEGGLYLPDNHVLLVRNNPIMQSLEIATNAHRNGKDFYPSPEQIEWALSGEHVDLREGERFIPVNAFTEDERTVFMFGKNTKAYADFLKENNFNEINIYLANSQDSAFVRQGWFYGLGVRSGVGVGDRGLDVGDRLRGVRGESTQAEISVRTYTFADISKALRDSNLGGIEAILSENLNR